VRNGLLWRTTSGGGRDQQLISANGAAAQQTGTLDRQASCSSASTSRVRSVVKTIVFSGALYGGQYRRRMGERNAAEVKASAKISSENADIYRVARVNPRVRCAYHARCARCARTARACCACASVSPSRT